MMKLLKTIQKKLQNHHLLLALGVVVLVYVVYQYSNTKHTALDTMTGENSVAPEVKREVRPSTADESKSQYGKVDKVSGKHADVPNKDMADPSELLPRDQNNEWSRLNPSGNNPLKNVNLLKAGYHAGIDTVGSTLRNANLQLRSEPPNPRNTVSPWLNSTIEPDPYRRPLEIGSRH